MARRPAIEQGDTVGRIRDAGFRLFGRYGYDGVSMLTVARDSDITKAALYWHYENKEALYADCMRRLVGLFEQHILAAAEREAEPVEQIFTLFTGLETLGADARVAHGIAGYWLRPSTVAAETAHAVQLAFEARSAAAVETIFEAAQAAGVLSRNGSVRAMARAFIAIMETIVLPLGGRSVSEQHRLVAALSQTFFQAHARAPEAAKRAQRLFA